MAVDQLKGVARHLHRAALLADGGGLSDGQLLEQFLLRKEEAAFEALVRRHGPMVLGVCRRVLHHRQDAEDAFQATFLVLVRKAAAIRPREQVGNWLYGVAYRTALKARATAARRRARERRARDVIAPAAEEPISRLDWQPLLDRELNRLPEKHRVLVVLCDLEGKSRKEVARQLGLAEGTVSSRLARARRNLARGLTRHGLTLSAATLTVLLSRRAAQAVPPALRATTAQAALLRATGMAVTGGLISAPVAALVEGVLQTMFVAKLQLMAVLLVTAGLIGLGGSFLGHDARADKPAATQAPEEEPDGKAKPAVGPQFPATVKTVDTGQGTVTVWVRTDPARKETTEKTYPLARNARVLLTDFRGKDEPGKDGKLTDLVEGLNVTVHLAPDQKTVTRIVVGPVDIHGSVKSVGAARHTLTVTSKTSKGPQEKTVTVPQAAKVLLNDGLSKGVKDKEGSLAELTEATPILVRVSALDQKTVLEIRVRHRSLLGMVKGVDLGNQTITVTAKENAQVVDRTLRVAKGARLGTPLGELNVGTLVQVDLSVVDPDTAVAIRVPAKDGKE